MSQQPNPYSLPPQQGNEPTGYVGPGGQLAPQQRPATPLASNSGSARRVVIVIITVVAAIIMLTLVGVMAMLVITS
ncbi:MAG: hypothetical protein L0G99_03935 [Propionibacteriales bacterium]|nr:hypothetical protein [Propionibacteriales bacterium]